MASATIKQEKTVTLKLNEKEASALAVYLSKSAQDQSLTEKQSACIADIFHVIAMLAIE